MPALTDPNYEIDPCGCFRCLNCRRSGARPGSDVKHARSCDLFPNRLAGPVVAPEQVAEEKAQRIAVAHESGICTWTKVEGRWVVTGPEAVLKAGRVSVQAKGKAPEQIDVYNVREVGGRWIADKRASTRTIREQVRPVSDDEIFDAYQRGQISMSDAMNRDF